jgi:hypothetical protein
MEGRFKYSLFIAIVVSLIVISVVNTSLIKFGAQVDCNINFEGMEKGVGSGEPKMGGTCTHEELKNYMRENNYPLFSVYPGTMFLTLIFSIVPVVLVFGLSFLGGWLIHCCRKPKKKNK